MPIQVPMPKWSKVCIHIAYFLKSNNILYFVGVMRRAENATVSQVGLGFFAIHLVLLVDMDKIARRNVTVKMERLVVILQVKYNHLF